MNNCGIRNCARAAVLTFCIAALLACEKPDRYKLEKDEQGRTIRIDQQTGEIAIIDGETIRVVQSQEQAEVDRKVEKALLGEPTVYPETEVEFFGKGVKAKLSHIWRDGNLHYKFSMYPASGKILKARATYGHSGGLFLRFYDLNEFEVVNVKVPTSDLVGIHDENNKVGHFASDGQIAITKENYESIAYWNIGWYGYE